MLNKILLFWRFFADNAGWGADMSGYFLRNLNGLTLFMGVSIGVSNERGFSDLIAVPIKIIHMLPDDNTKSAENR